MVLGKEENYILENEEEILYSQKNIKENQDYKNFTSYKTSLRKINQLRDTIDLENDKSIVNETQNAIGERWKDK